MEYRQIGGSGLTTSVVVLGSADFGTRVAQREVEQIVAAAVDHGVTMIDTAEAYGPGHSEEALGRAIGPHRDRLVLATKFGHVDRAPDNAPGSRRNVRRAVEASLRRLRTDYLDLYYLHHPDPSTPLEETLGALGELVTAGKVRYAGACNFAGWQLADAEWIARTNVIAARLVAAQNRYNVIDRSAESELLPACLAHGIGFVPYSPLARGLLNGRHRRGVPIGPDTLMSSRGIQPSPADYDRVESIHAYADERGRSMIEVAFGALLARPGVSAVLMGASSVGQLVENVAATGWTPSEADLAALERSLSRPA